ncbi:hypothetical protein BJX66DRAFT_308344 [Aspergillus keveii]|uniref:Uncharacterized protein n=1 Tax=Aspergillus keveii TaxID=714993 RepID=A0ABR4FZK1_9EURO
MRGLRPRWGFCRGSRISPTAMTVLKTADICRVPVCATDNAKEAVVGGPAAYHHTFLVAPRDPELPMLSHRDTPYHSLEILQRGKPLAHVEARINLCHLESRSGEAARSEQRLDDNGTFHQCSPIRCCWIRSLHGRFRIVYMQRRTRKFGR